MNPDTCTAAEAKVLLARLATYYKSTPLSESDEYLTVAMGRTFRSIMKDWTK